MGLYRMNVFAADGTTVVPNYTWSEWLDNAEGGADGTEGPELLS
jgi:hypothetical protein